MKGRWWLALCGVLLIVFICGEVWAAGATPVPRRRAARTRATRTHDTYVRTHDVNNDGVVNARDRLMWIDRNRATVTTVVIDDSNEDLYEAMDFNKDGKVTKAEIDRFYAIYDTNGNGVLEEVEIERAVD